MVCVHTYRISPNGSGREFQDHDKDEVNDRQGRKGDGNGCNSLY